MLSFEKAEFRFDPYPIGLISSVMAADVYAKLVDTFPSVELFHYQPQSGSKYVLSEKFNDRNYHEFIQQHPPWRDLHDWIKSPEFVEAVDATLREHCIDMGLSHAHLNTHGTLAWRLGSLAKGRWPRGDEALQTRFEFSMLPARGGYVIPHTDTPRKIITLVVFMVKEGEWDPSYGGGVEIGRATDDRFAFNWVNEQIPFEVVEAVDTFEFQPNRCVIFVKTFNSLHCVRPMTGGRDLMRRSITINITRPE